ncbi:MAG: hypothetical protein GF344_13485 [Chitinivibrionales bacterium]|nr:hypothetical protein [Chitinivibrionales bacterium]MBD3357743.1 hypothetical protein [Chitinivibrionales bacterium]
MRNHGNRHGTVFYSCPPGRVTPNDDYLCQAEGPCGPTKAAAVKPPPSTSESVAVRQALDYLYGAGHRRLAFVVTDATSWILNRARLMRTLAATHFPAREVVTLPVFVKAKSRLDLLRSYVERNVSVLLMPNMRITERCYPALRYYRKQLRAENVSIMTFDPVGGRDPITSVDFGFGPLGYFAFHAIVQDIPVPISRRKDIVAVPGIMDRGSVIPVN